MNSNIFNYCNSSILTFVCLLTGLVGCQPRQQAITYAYPLSKTVTASDTFHQTIVSDPYRWLEESQSEEVKNWIKAQDEYARSFLDSLPQRAAIAQRLKEINDLQPGISGVPRKANGIYFFSSRKLQPAGLYWQKGKDAQPALLLAYGALSKKGDNLRVVEFEPSPDGKYLAFGVGARGSQWNTWYLLNTETKEWLRDEIKGLYLFYSQIAWAKDSKGFFYGGFQPPKAGDKQAAPQQHAIKYHRIHTPQTADELVYEDTANPGWIFRGEVSQEGDYYVFHSIGRQVNNVYYKNLKGRDRRVKIVADGRKHRYLLLGNQGADFYFATGKDAPNLKVIKVNITQPEPDNWQEIIPEKEYAINTAKLLGGKLVVEYLKDVSSMVEIYDLHGNRMHQVGLPYIGGWLVSRRSTGFMTSFVGSPTDTEAFFGMTGQTDPGSVYRLDISSGKIRVHSRPKINFKPEDFTVKQVFYPSKDDTKIPMFLIYKTDLFKKNGTNPTWLYAYGYNFPSTLYYLNNIIVWMEMGGIYAYPGIRGGSDYGQAWIEAGAGKNKQTAIDDYIFAGKWLVENGYTKANQLIANGGSASGPLPAAAINQAPEQFGLAYIDIPLLDMVRMYDYLSGITTTGWGDRKKAEDFKALYDWSPYHNIQAQSYPPVIIAPGEKDQLAFPLHAYKYTAAMQAAQQEKSRPIFLQVSWEAGHSINNEILVNQLAFAAEWLGIKLEK